tara:strand:- start:13842 stop:15332 length:1491 start_codon:yes stop_codon:yes gene_type:complete
MSELHQASLDSGRDVQYVDRRNRTIVGYAVMSVGEAKGHGVRADYVTLAQIIELGNQPNKGIKVRWTHPSMIADGMGKYLGRAVNFRLSEDGTKALADMIISKTASNSPMGNLGGYVLDLASEDPEAFGTSVVIQYTTIESEDVSELPVIRVSKLYASDVVDEPAANEGLFSASNPGLFSREVKNMLDAMLEREPVEKVRERLEKEIESQLKCGKIEETHQQTQEAEMSVEEIHEEAEALEAAKAVVSELSDREEAEAVVEEDAVEVEAEAAVAEETEVVEGESDEPKEETEADEAAVEEEAELSAQPEADADAPADAPAEPVELEDAPAPEATEECCGEEGCEHEEGEQPEAAAEEPAVEPAAEVEADAVEPEAAAEEGEVELSAADIAKQAVEGERARVKEVRELCEMAGKAGLSAQYIDAGLSASETREKLFEEMCKGVGLGVADAAPAAPADPHASYRAEYRAAKAEYGNLITSTEDDYVKSRVIEDSQNLI